jgi:hypothetical protein
MGGAAGVDQWKRDAGGADRMGGAAGVDQWKRAGPERPGPQGLERGTMSSLTSHVCVGVRIPYTNPHIRCELERREAGIPPNRERGPSGPARRATSG